MTQWQADYVSIDAFFTRTSQTRVIWEKAGNGCGSGRTHFLLFLEEAREWNQRSSPNSTSTVSSSTERKGFADEDLICLIHSFVSIYLDDGVWSCWETTPRLGIFLLNLAIHCFCSFSLVHITSNSFTDSLSLTGRRETEVETCSATSADRFTSAWLHEFFSIIVMLFMTTNMTSSAFETWRRREDIVTRTITCFTLSGHTVGNNDETMTFVFNGFSTVSILILGREHQCRDRQRRHFFLLEAESWN